MADTHLGRDSRAGTTPALPYPHVALVVCDARCPACPTASPPSEVGMKSLRFSLLMLLTAAALWGCSRNSVRATDPSSTTHESDLVVAELAQQQAIMEDGVSDDRAEIGLGGEGGFAAIQPRYFRRVIRHRERTFEFRLSAADR